MWISKLFLCLIVSTTVYGESSSLSKEGGKLFANAKKSVYQIKTSLTADSPKASYGSGFSVQGDKTNLIVTNYHVVSQSIQDKNGKYKVFIVVGGKNIEADVINFSIIHDLAILNPREEVQTTIKLALVAPEKGHKVFSLGLPKDLNLSLSEGTYNGILKYGIYEEIHMSSPINSGMSGGPTLNENGEVIGINVSILLNSQNISFSVPVKFAKELLSSEMTTSKKKIKYLEAQEIIEQQLFQVQESLTGNFLDKSELFTSLDNWKIPQSPASLKCWSENQDADSYTYVLNRQFCHLNSSMFIKEGLNSGTYDIQFLSLVNKGRNRFQFYNLIDYFYNEIFFDTNYDFDESKGTFTKELCNQNIVVYNQELPLKLNYCLVGHVEHKGIYNGNFKAAMIGSRQKSLLVQMKFNGFSISNMKKIVEKILSTISYEDGTK